MKAGNNVLLFPKTPGVIPPQNVERARKIVTGLQVDEAVNYIGEVLATSFLECGYDFDFENSNTYLKDFALVLETVRSVLNKYHDIEHPLQQYAEEKFVYENDEYLVYTGDETTGD